MAYVTVYPLVSARAVARPFTYEAPDEVGKGTVVSVPSAVFRMEQGQYALAKRYDERDYTAYDGTLPSVGTCPR